MVFTQQDPGRLRFSLARTVEVNARDGARKSAGHPRPAGTRCQADPRVAGPGGQVVIRVRGPRAWTHMATPRSARLA